MVYMPEMIEIRGALGGGVDGDIAGVLLQRLVEEGKLPADFQFRLLGISDWRERNALILQDIKALMGEGEPTNHPYLTGPLPDAVIVNSNNPKRPILAALSEDYHMYADFGRIAEGMKIAPHYATSTWADYVGIINPELAAQLLEVRDPRGPRAQLMSKEAQYWNAVRQVVIKDVALMGIYHSRPRGHGPMRQEMLKELLLDNHPELLA
jgi:hypothetical protein